MNKPQTTCNFQKLFQSFLDAAKKQAISTGTRSLITVESNIEYADSNGEKKHSTLTYKYKQGETCEDISYFSVEAKTKAGFINAFRDLGIGIDCQDENFIKYQADAYRSHGLTTSSPGTTRPTKNTPLGTIIPGKFKIIMGHKYLTPEKFPEITAFNSKRRKNDTASSDRNTNFNSKRRKNDKASRDRNTKANKRRKIGSPLNAWEWWAVSTARVARDGSLSFSQIPGRSTPMDGSNTGPSSSHNSTQSGNGSNLGSGLFHSFPSGQRSEPADMSQQDLNQGSGSINNSLDGLPDGSASSGSGSGLFDPFFHEYSNKNISGNDIQQLHTGGPDCESQGPTFLDGLFGWGSAGPDPNQFQPNDIPKNPVSADRDGQDAGHNNLTAGA